jgi:pilus assembly protein CpaF
MLQAMNTGHEGSLTTIHANSPRDALARLEVLVLMAGLDLPLRAIREQISSAFDVVIQLTRRADGSRRVTHVTEVLRMESDVVTVQDLFVAKAEVGADGTVSARPRPTGIRPSFGDKLAASGVTLPPEVFDPAERKPAIVSTGRRRS